MKFSAKDIIQLYSYTEDEQESFEYLHRYMNLITPKLPEIENDKEKLKRFALIGLFLAYRAGNHMGNDLTTEIELEDKESRHSKRIIAIKVFFDLKILNSLQYLEMINLSFFELALTLCKVKNIAKIFYRFVMFGGNKKISFIILKKIFDYEKQY
jgi:hypothetical protein